MGSKGAILVVDDERATREMAGFFLELIQDRKRKPAPDLLSQLVSLEDLRSTARLMAAFVRRLDEESDFVQR